MSETGQLPELESLRTQVAGLARELAERDRALQPRQQGVDSELQDLRKQSDLLQAIMEGTAADTGDDFFASLATHLTSTLHMQYAVIGEVLEKTPARIRTLAVSSGGTILENFEYDLAIAPCGTGLTESFWCFEQNVQALFPNFPPLAAMGVESHSGVSIRNKQGKVIGLIVVMDTQPIAQQDRLQILLRMFAPRVAAELQRKQADMALRESEARTRSILETALDAVISIDEHSRIIGWNSQAKVMFGYSAQEVLGLQLEHTIIPARYRQAHIQSMGRMLQSNDSSTIRRRFEFFALHRSGQEFPVEFAIALSHVDGQPMFTAFIRDITEHKQLAEREASRIRQLKKLSELSLTLSGDPAVVFDQVVRIIGDLFNVPVVYLSEIVGEELYVKSVYVDGQILRSEEHCPLAVAPCGTVAQAKDRRIFDRVMERFPQDTFLKDHEAYTYYGFPALDSQGTVVAVTCLLEINPHKNNLHTLAEEEHELLRIIGQRIAVEIERSRHISEKQRAEDALRQNHVLLSAIMETTTDIIFAKDLEGRYLHMNPAGARVFGLSPQEIVGKNDDALLPADLAAYCKDTDRQVLATGSAQTTEESSLANGKRTTYLTTKIPYRDAAGHMIGIIGAAHDISHIKQSEEALRRSHAFIRQIIDTVPNFISAKDRDGRFTLVNKAVADAYGTTVDHLTGKTDADFNSNTQEVAHFRKIDLEVLDSLREQFIAEEMITDAAGRTRWLQTVKRPIMDETGRTPMVLGASTDITERKRMEDALRQRECDLRTALDERERISQDLHDGILQSLYAVGLWLEGCKPLMTQQDYKKSAAAVDRAIGQLNHVMSEVRNFIAGLESQLLQKSPFPMALRTMVLTLTADHPIPCTLTIDESLTNTFSTEQALHLLNVAREALSNSLRHSGATKTTVSLKSLSRSIRLTVADNGRGFDPVSMYGVGHGLTNMEARARKVGGRFAIKSTPQHGTRITIDVSNETGHAGSKSKHGSTAARR